jgi:mono/diheme cytochrome c family protein
VRRRKLIAIGGLLWVVSVAHAGDVDKGKTLYTGRCAFCHGATGKGDGPVGAALKPPPSNFASTDYWKTSNDEQAKNAIKNGKPGTPMVPFGSSLSSDDIENLLAYLKTFAPK